MAPSRYMPTTDGKVAYIGQSSVSVLTIEEAMAQAGFLAEWAEKAQAQPDMVTLGWDRSYALSAKACVEAAKEAAQIRRSREAQLALAVAA
jgi:hypothetical protein